MNKQSLFLILAVSATAIGLNGCSNNEQTGAVIGSLVGAGLGKSTSNHRDKRAVIGAIVGGMVGGAIGKNKDVAANRGYATTAPYYNGSSSNGSSHAHGGSTHSHTTNNKQVAPKPSISHTHGNRTHSHPGGSGQHAHNMGNTSNNTTAAQQSHSHAPQTRTVYVERPYYPVTTSVVLGGGYYAPRRHYRNRHHYRHHNRIRHHNRHNRVRHRRH